MKKILIVDDSQKWVEYHQKIVLELFGNDVNITTANSAREGYDCVFLNIDEPFDIILTDMQMETDFAPLYAGEWLIRQIQSLKEYINTRIIIISATYNIRLIAEKYGVLCIPKADCRLPESYKILLGN